jgi:protein-tyrosine phosphatase
MKIDFHSHILPGIDDGSKNIEESVKLLDKMAEDGVDIVIATPHFYCSKISIHRFLDRRNAAFEQLKPHLKPEHPRILLGAEVLYSSALVGKDALTRLAIQGTDFMLLEMPYKKLTPSIIDDVDKIANDRDVKLIIAHIERYLQFTDAKSLGELMELNVLGQINAQSLTHFRTRSQCFKLVKKGYVHLLGTDIHRIERNDAPLSVGLNTLSAKFGEDFIKKLEQNGKDVLSDSPIEQLLI